MPELKSHNASNALSVMIHITHAHAFKPLFSLSDINALRHFAFIFFVAALIQLNSLELLTPFMTQIFRRDVNDDFCTFFSTRNGGVDTQTRRRHYQGYIYTQW